MNIKKKEIITIIIISIFSLLLLFYSFFKEDNYRYLISNSEKKEATSEVEDIKKDLEELENSDSESNEETYFVIYLSGEVNSPGVYKVKEDTRLYEVIEQAGGFTIDADRENINLAVRVEDEKHYIIYKKGELETQINQIDKDKINENGDGKININLAESQELKKLSGIGDKTAEKIIDYRNSNGNFKSIDEIKNVNGIGDKKFEEIKDSICVK